MNKPRVEALYYKITHAEDVVYEGVQPRNYETPNFSIRLEKDMAEIILKTDHQRVNDAQDEIEPFLRVWELTAALEFEPGFKFQYQRATGVDRNIRVEVADHALATATSKEQPVRSRYPDPPCTSLERDEAVELMFKTYCLYRQERMKLGEAANFCLTVCEYFSDGKLKRKAAAKRYKIAKTILDHLATLAVNKGGGEARKARGVTKPFSSAEREWLETVVKCLILRAAAVAGNPSGSFKQITKPDLDQEGLWRLCLSTE